MEDLYVRPEYRGRGYGRGLLGRVAEEVVGMGDGGGGGRLEWEVLRWNEGAIGFYEGVVGAGRREEWVGMRVEGREGLEGLVEVGRRGGKKGKGGEGG